MIIMVMVVVMMKRIQIILPCVIDNVSGITPSAKSSEVDISISHLQIRKLKLMKRKGLSDNPKSHA
jgi:hypothetical protein